MQYQIRHFDGYKIHDFCKNGDKYVIDATDKLTWQTVLQSTDSHDDNALFYQLVKVLYELNSDKLNTIETSECLLEEIVFVHFSYGITNEYRKLFSDGFILSCENRDITYIPFEKSASMARQGVITFVNKDLLDLGETNKSILKRLMLDIDLEKNQIALSKLYAYRGLYLSSGKRVVSKELLLDKDTVVVIDDITDKSETTDIITAITDENQLKKCNEEESETKQFSVLTKKNQKIKGLNASDGFGFISPEYAKIINNDLGIEGATSFQIRMPFTKGMLHQVDFKKFIKSNLLNKQNQKELIIKDIYGVNRNISKAQIILAKSMFKCWKWLKESVGECQDPMAHFFEKFSEYDHALYVGLTDLNLHNNGQVKLNYQFLSTLNISKEDFRTLKNIHLKYAEDNAVVKSIIAKKYTVNVRNEEETGLDGDLNEETYNYNAAWVEAVRKNYKFITTSKVCGMLNGLKRSIISDMGKGRLYVSGELRFLCGDLGYMLLDILKKCMKENKAIDFQKREERTIYTSNFYMPGNNIKLERKKFYAILRNPHLSRNEQALAEPYIAKVGSFYDEYFSHLKGVIMLSTNALIPNILGGADYDGDMVKVINDNIINNALLKDDEKELAPYKMLKKSNEEGKTSKCPERCMPVIEIPSLQPITSEENDDNKFKTIKNSFNSKVGLISNIAVKYAEKEYFSDVKNAEYKNKTPECTIVTGLEIDAAKTGVHPEISHLKTNEECYFLKQKSKMSPDIYKSNYKPERASDEKTLALYLIKKDGSHKNLLVTENYEESDVTSNIDRLPYYFAEEMANFTSFKNTKDFVLPNFYFKFEEPSKENSSWENELNEDVKSKVKDMIQAYNTLKKNISRMNYASQRYANSTNSSYIYSILKSQYDEVDEEIKEALYSAYKIIEKTLSAYTDAKKLRKKFLDLKWHFSLSEERGEKLKQLLESTKIEAKVLNLITNFNCNGYKLLYYIIEDVIAEFTDNNIDKYEADTLFSCLTEDGLEFYFNYKDKYINSVRNKEQISLYKQKLVSTCRADLRKVIGPFLKKQNNEYTEDDIMNEAIKYVYSVEKNTSWPFLWDVFTAKEILRNVYDGKQVKNNA